LHGHTHREWSAPLFIARSLVWVVGLGGLETRRVSALGERFFLIPGRWIGDQKDALISGLFAIGHEIDRARIAKRNVELLTDAAADQFEAMTQRIHVDGCVGDALRGRRIKVERRNFDGPSSAQRVHASLGKGTAFRRVKNGLVAENNTQLGEEL